MTPFTSSNHSYIASIARYLFGIGAALWLLIMAMQPDVGFVAPLPWMGVFWFLQTSIGLFVLQSVLYLLSRLERVQQWPLWLLVTGSGIIGSAVLTPIYWLIGEGLMESLLGFRALADDDDDDVTEHIFGAAALIQEFGNIVAPVTASWILISWPRLQGLLPPLIFRQSKPYISEIVMEEQPMDGRASSTNPAWRSSLPAELGSDVTAVTSEMQYLRVWTTKGSALILGALQEVEDTEGSAGIRVHRSWWVNASHVRCVRRTRNMLVCKLDDGREIPVSRRRKNEVLARFGDTAIYDAVPEVTAVPAIKPQSPNSR